MKKGPRAKDQDGHEIVLRTVKKLLNGKMEQTAEKI